MEKTSQESSEDESKAKSDEGECKNAASINVKNQVSR